MRPFDSVIVVDWSAGNDRGPRPKKDAIWIGAVLGGREIEPEYHRNRKVAEQALALLLEAEVAAGRRILVGFDFPFGYPEGFAERVVGTPDPFALWEWFAANLEDSPKSNNRFQIAGRLNRLFPGTGPFWFNGTASEIADLPRKGRLRGGHGMRERRRVEELARAAFSLWQMGGAGAVGGQAMTGMAALSRLRRRFEGKVSVWPFEALDRPIAFVEVWPTLLSAKVAGEKDAIKDRAQVRLLSRALANLSDAQLHAMLSVDAPEEGWILGVGHEEELLAAA